MHILSLEIAHSIHCTTCYPCILYLILYILYTAGALPAVLAGAVVAFLLLTLLIAGIIVGAVLFGRAKRRGKEKERRTKSVELIECVEKREEIVEVSLTGTSSTGNDSERQINDNLVRHYERVQPNDEPGYESVDVAQQGRISQVDGKGSRSKRDYYNVAEVTENISSEDIGQDTQEADTEEQHYEWSNVFGQDWLGNVVGESSRQERERESAGFQV